MAYDQRHQPARTDTTRHLNPEEVHERRRGERGYWEGARHRSAQFAQSTAQLRELRAELDSLGREALNRPTGVLSGSDVDIAYHYLGIGLGVVATLYSVLGTVFALHGGSAAMVDLIRQRWAAGPATALTEALLNAHTIVALILQVILFVVIIGTRRNRRSWQHWGTMIASTGLTYVGWSSLLLAFGTAPVAAITATIPAVLLGGAITWVAARTASDTLLPRHLMVGLIVVGVLAGALGTTALIHWAGLMLAWSADQVARRIMVIG